MTVVIFFSIQSCSRSNVIRVEFDRVTSTYFQAAVRKQPVALRRRVTTRCECTGRDFCPAQAIIMTEMKMIVLLPSFEAGSEWRLCLCRKWSSNDVQIVTIDFHQNGENVAVVGARTDSALRAGRISHWKRLMTSHMNSGCQHSLQLYVCLLYVEFMTEKKWAVKQTQCLWPIPAIS